MDALVAKGDHDPANYRELAGLARETAQWKQQLAMLEEVSQNIIQGAVKVPNSESSWRELGGQ